MNEASTIRRSPNLLQVLRLVPEPIKDRLRPAALGVITACQRIPGAYRAARIFKRVAPGAYAWANRRYTHYAETAAILRQLAREEAAIEIHIPTDLSDDEQLVFCRLRQNITQRRR